LRIALPIFRHVRGRVTAGIEGDAAIAAREEAQLRLIAAIIAGKFVHENDRVAGPRLLVIEAHAIVGGHMGHRKSSRTGTGRYPRSARGGAARRRSLNGGAGVPFNPAERELLRAASVRGSEEPTMRSDREERIRQRAYAIWQSEGHGHGRHEDHWHRAEQEIAAEEAGSSKAPRRAPRSGKAAAAKSA